MIAYIFSLDGTALLRACPGGVAQGLIWGIMALGVFMTFRMLNFADLTVDGSFATGGAVCIMLIMKGCNPEVALIVSFVAGLLAGLVTGILHTVFGIPDILAGILTQLGLWSVNLKLLGGKSNQAINVNLVTLHITSNARFLSRTIIIMVVFCAILISILYWYLGTEQGSAIRATGINPKMSRAQGINTDAMKVLALALSNGMVALAGGILAQFQGFADANMGRGAIVIGLAAVIIGEVIGEAIFKKGMNFILRLGFVVVGGVIYYLVYVLVLWLKFPANDMKLLTALVVAAFLAVPYLKEKKKSSFHKVARENKKSGIISGKGEE